MIGLRKKKEEPIQRSPQIVRQKQSVFHYSSNRTGTERIYNRGESIDEEDKSGRFVELRIVKLGAVIATVALIAGSVFLAVLSGSSKVVFVDSEPIRLQSEYTRVASEASKQGLGGLLKFTINRQDPQIGQPFLFA